MRIYGCDLVAVPCLKDEDYCVSDDDGSVLDASPSKIACASAQEQLEHDAEEDDAQTSE